ncbi:hypothetical protein EPN95_00250 [Patescibacteria group bacterium]|nr:MAG: hypothetical protein EPN95_00250 [Patescibacteria group bacterium]
MLKKLIRNPFLYILLVSYYCIWLIWDGIKLPFHNPADIISSLPLMGYNPANNILRFVLAVLVPPVACLLVWLVLNRRPKRFWKFYGRVRYPRIILGTIIVMVCVLLTVAMGIEQNSTNPANNQTGVYGGPYSHALVDTFHEGETLGPALAYEQPNLAPYRDFVMIHGVFQDALRSVIAFKLFGTSIAATRAFTVILGIIAFLSYYILLLVLFKGNLFKSATGLWVLALLMLPATTLPFIGSSIFGVQFPFRDIATILFLITAVTGLRLIPTDKKKKLMIASLVIGFIATAGFANSLDRALYVGALSVVWLVLGYIMFNAPKRFLKNVFLPYCVGFLLGIPILGMALKWDYADFLNYAFNMSRYKEYLDGIVLTRPNFAIGLTLVVVAALITAVGATLISVLKKPLKSKRGIKSKIYAIQLTITPLVRKYSIPILLLATGAFFLRSAIGRTLPDHWVYSVQWLYLSLLYVGVNYAYNKFKDRQKIFNFVTVMILGFVFIFFGIAVKHIDIRNDTFPINVPDSVLMRADYIQTANYLKQHLTGDETFVTLTSEWSWYYFVGKPSPIRYAVIWYAFTKDQRLEIANEVDKGTNIKYIITNNNWTTDFDYVPNKTRFPELYSVLKKDYVQYVGFGQQTIWIRK